MGSHFAINSGQRPRPANGWHQVERLRRGRATLGVKGESPLAQAMIAQTLPLGKSFCKHGYRASVLKMPKCLTTFKGV